MTTVLIDSTMAETWNVSRSDSGANLGTLRPLASPSLEAIEDFLDIQTGLRTEALYREHGRSAFIPLETYKQRRRGRSV